MATITTKLYVSGIEFQAEYEEIDHEILDMAISFGGEPLFNIRGSEIEDFCEGLHALIEKYRI